MCGQNGKQYSVYNVKGKCCWVGIILYYRSIIIIICLGSCILLFNTFNIRNSTPIFYFHLFIFLLSYFKEEKNEPDVGLDD